MYYLGMLAQESWLKSSLSNEKTWISIGASDAGITGGSDTLFREQWKLPSFSGSMESQKYVFHFFF